jgi:hypothetical protein
MIIKLFTTNKYRTRNEVVEFLKKILIYKNDLLSV